MKSFKYKKKFSIKKHFHLIVWRFKHQMNKEKYLDGIQSGKRIGVESFMSGFMEHVERCASHHVKGKRSFPIRGHSVNVLGRTFFYFAFLTSRMDSSVSLSENLTFSVIDLFFFCEGLVCTMKAKKLEAGKL